MAGKKRALAALLMVVMLSGGVNAADNETATAQVAIRGGPGTGITLEVQNAVFNVITITLRYDIEQVKPAGGFDDTVKRTAEASWLNFIDKRLDEEQGLLNITAYVSPGLSGESGFDEGGHAIVGESALTLFTLHFTRISDTGNPILSLAVRDDGDAYYELNPQGAALLRMGLEQPFALTFALSDGGAPVQKPHTHSFPGTQVAGLSMTREERLTDTILLPIGGAQAVVEGTVVSIYPEEPGVTAYAHSGRTFVPVRFVAERLGAEIMWVNETQTIIIEKDGRAVTMTVGALAYTIDGEVKELDVPAEFFRDPNAENARTMVPIRFVAEALAMNVLWESNSNFVIISPEAAPWNPDRRLEQELLQDAQLILSPFIQNFVPQR